MIRPLDYYNEEESKRARLSVDSSTSRVVNNLFCDRQMINIDIKKKYERRGIRKCCNCYNETDIFVKESHTCDENANVNGFAHAVELNVNGGLNERIKATSVFSESIEDSVTDRTNADNLIKNNVHDSNPSLIAIDDEGSNSTSKSELSSSKSFQLGVISNSAYFPASVSISATLVDSLGVNMQKSSCENVFCLNNTYCCSPSHKNKFYQFKSIMKEQCNNVSESLPSSKNNVPSSHLCTSSNVSCPSDQATIANCSSVLSVSTNINLSKITSRDDGPLMSHEVFRRQLSKSCMNGPTSVYPSPRRYPRTSFCKDLNCDSSSPSLQSDRPSIFTGGSFLSSGGSDVYQPSLDHNSVPDGSCLPKTVSKQSENSGKGETGYQKSAEITFPCDQSDKSIPSKVYDIKNSVCCVDVSLSSPNQSLIEDANLSCNNSMYSDKNKCSEFFLERTSDVSLRSNSDQPEYDSTYVKPAERESYKKFHSNAVLCKDAIDNCLLSDYLNNSEGGSQCNLSDISNDFTSDDEDDDLCCDDIPYGDQDDVDTLDRDGSSMTSSLNSPSTSTDIYTPALSFGTSSSAALTEVLDSLSLQSSCDFDFASCSSDQLSNFEHDFQQDQQEFNQNNIHVRYKSPLRPSLFPGLPPTIYFSVEGETVCPLPSNIRHHLRWKLSTITPLIMRKTVTRAGISLTKSTTDWCGTWGKQVKVVNFKAVKSYQKVNHFPWTFQIGRKDKLWRNVWRMRMKHGHSDFHFLPQTYILPHDVQALKRAWENMNQKKPRIRHKWIVKPPASARGQGIKVIHKWSQIPKKWPLIVQKYLSKPYLINGSKFDLRLYVLVTSFNPLRIYVFDDGLVRFASVKYSANVRSLSDKFMHLTNYSINKKSSSYTANEDVHACQGHKWSLKSLWRYMENEGIDTDNLRNDIVDIIIKTIISCEFSVTNMIERYVKSSFNCYELFGFDIMLDDKLKPWLLEVNISPSLHSNSPLDASIKGQLAKDLLNVAGFHIPNRLSDNSKASIMTKFGLSPDKGPLCHDKKFYTHMLTAGEKAKHAQYQEMYLMLGITQTSILDRLTADDMRQLMTSEDELTRCGQFVRVFPSSMSHHYHKYFENLHYYDILLNVWETSYHNNRLPGISRLQNLYRRHLDQEKKTENKITCKSPVKEESKTSKRYVKLSHKIRKQRKPYGHKNEKKTSSRFDNQLKASMSSCAKLTPLG